MSTQEFIEKTGFTAEQLTSASRIAELCTARHVCMWIMSNSGMRLAVIGRIFNRNHATVIHATKKINDMISINDMETKKHIERLQNYQLQLEL